MLSFSAFTPFLVLLKRKNYNLLSDKRLACKATFHFPIEAPFPRLASESEVEVQEVLH